MVGLRETPTWYDFWQVLFVTVDVAADNGHVLNYFGLKAEEAPTLRFINVETTKKYAPTGVVPITAASVTAFCQGVFHGEIKVCSLGGRKNSTPRPLAPAHGSLLASPALSPEPGDTP